MEPWHILLSVAMLCLTYLVAKFIAHMTDKKKIDAETEKLKDVQEAARTMLETHRAVFEAATKIGRADHMATGTLRRDERRIAFPKRASGIRTTRSTEHVCITVDQLNARNKSNPILFVREKNSSDSFKAELSLNPADYPDYDKISDIIWDSARFPDKYFWAAITFTKRRNKIISASISSIGLSEDDLPQTTQEPED